MKNHPFLALAITLASLGLAGCADPGTTITADASLDFDGKGSGSHSDDATCDDEGAITGTGTLTDGKVSLTVTDSDGTELFTRSFEDSFTLDRTTFKGDSGGWRIEARRAPDDLVGDDFAGKYNFYLSC